MQSPVITRAVLGMAAVAAGLAWAAAPADAASVSAKVKDQRLLVDGTSAADVVALRLDPARTDVVQVDVGDNGSADFSFARSTFTHIDVTTLGGADHVRIDDARGAFTDTERTTIDGGADHDILRGGQGPEVLIGGAGSDLLSGGRGADVVLGGTEADLLVWNPGDGSDVVDGQADHDTLQFNGSGAAEMLDIRSNGARVMLYRDVGAITMDLNEVETIDYGAVGGADSVNVGNVTGTHLREVDADFAGCAGCTAGDGRVDRITVEGTPARDVVEAVGRAGHMQVLGTPASLRIRNAEASDVVSVKAAGGDDTIMAGTLPAAAISLVLDGGYGNDAIVGGQGNDVILGGAGRDVVDGDRGNDVALLGSEDDTYVWNPGEGSDTIEGQAGADRLTFNGSGAAEKVTVAANSGRVRLVRDVGGIVTDLDDVETIGYAAVGGADTVTIGDLTGTDVSAAEVDLAAVLGGTLGDRLADRVNVTGTALVDTIQVAGSNRTAVVSGLKARVTVRNSDGITDTLAINTLAGADKVSSSGLAPGTIGLVVN